MFKRIVFVTMIAVLALALLPMHISAQEGEEPVRTGFRPDAPPYGVRGPHLVGYMTFSDGDAKRPMEGGIWYPAIPADGSVEAIDYDTGLGDLVPLLGTMPGRAILDGKPDTGNGPYPLIIYSHGMRSGGKSGVVLRLEGG
jgi:hypothetical protein